MVTSADRLRGSIMLVPGSPLLPVPTAVPVNWSGHVAPWQALGAPRLIRTSSGTVPVSPGGISTVACESPISSMEAGHAGLASSTVTVVEITRIANACGLVTCASSVACAPG